MRSSGWSAICARFATPSRAGSGPRRPGFAEPRGRMSPAPPELRSRRGLHRSSHCRRSSCGGSDPPASSAGPISPRFAVSSRPSAHLEIAAAGEHGLLMIGPPGAGKTLLAQRLPGLLPPIGLPRVPGSRLPGIRRGPQTQSRRPPAVSQPAAHGLDRSTDRRRRPAARRALAGASGRAVSRRISRISAQCAGGTARTPRERRGEAHAAQAYLRVSRADSNWWPR